MGPLSSAVEVVVARGVRMTKCVRKMKRGKHDSSGGQWLPLSALEERIKIGREARWEFGQNQPSPTHERASAWTVLLGFLAFHCSSLLSPALCKYPPTPPPTPQSPPSPKDLGSLFSLAPETRAALSKVL